MTSRRRRPRIDDKVTYPKKLALLALTLVPMMAARSAETPHAAAAQLAEQWLQLCEQPDLAAMTQWLRDNLADKAQEMFPAEDAAQEDVALCAANGGLRVAQRTVTEPDAASV